MDLCARRGVGGCYGRMGKVLLRRKRGANIKKFN